MFFIHLIQISNNLLSATLEKKMKSFEDEMIRNGDVLLELNNYIHKFIRIHLIR